MQKSKSLKYLLGCFTALLSVNTHAAGSQLFFNNASGLGNDYAGEVAIADDASTEYFNPAGLSLIPNRQMVVGDVQARFNGRFRGSDNFSLPPFVFIPQSGLAKGQPTLPPYPFFYYAMPLCHGLTFGIGVMTPEGIGVGIPERSLVRYSGTRAIIYIIDISPGIAYQFNERFSAGLALDIQRLAYTTVAMFPSFTGGPDARIRNDAIRWGYGWHGGLLYQMSPCLRTGFAYHSQSVFHPRGQSSYVFTPNTDVGTEIVSNNFHFTSVIPQSATISAYYQQNPCLALMGTVDYTRWRQIKSTTLYNLAIPDEFGGPSQFNSTIPQHYRDTWRLALGANYAFNPQWKLRMGSAYENDPTNPRYRSITDPGTGSISLAVGAHYQYCRQLGLDAGYIHYFMKSSKVNIVNGLNIENGKVRLQRDAAGLQATWDFV